jgi:hypothetical protein
MDSGHVLLLQIVAKTDGYSGSDMRNLIQVSAPEVTYRKEEERGG